MKIRPWVEDVFFWIVWFLMLPGFALYYFISLFVDLELDSRDKLFFAAITTLLVSPTFIALIVNLLSR